METIDREAKPFKLTHARWQKLTRLLKQYEGWSSSLRAEHGHDLVLFLEESSILDERVIDAPGAIELLRREGIEGEPFETTVEREDDEVIVVRAVEGKSGLARTHRLPKSLFASNDYVQFVRVHASLAELAGTP